MSPIFTPRDMKPGAPEGRDQADCARDDVLHECVGLGHPVSRRLRLRAVGGGDEVHLREPHGDGENNFTFDIFHVPRPVRLT